jgi:lambda family phage portal protein
VLKLNALDRLISIFDPVGAFHRGRARHVLAQYEGGKPSRVRKAMNDSRSPDQLVGASAIRLRNYARHQERNLDIARGVLNVLVRNVVGPNGISIEPMPRRIDGSVHSEFADQLMKLHKDWARRPEVTWQMGWPTVQHQAARTMFRDGEGFAQSVEGFVAYLDHGTRVPFSLELMEPDLVPLDYDDPTRGIRQGVEMSQWHRPRAYWAYKSHPGDSGFASFPQLKRVDAERMMHFALRDRLHQVRGVSIFASVINRLEDIKEYEDSERIAARVAAALTAVIKRDPENTADVPAPAGPLKIEAGTVFDAAGPGDEVTMVDSRRPNPQVEPFRMGQLRAASSGVSASFSSISKNYDGSYSAQRQELVEQWPEYQVLTGVFVHQFVQPVWERFVGIAVLSGLLRIPADLDVSTMLNAEFIGPPMPWIDPLKEIAASRMRVRTGERSLTQIIRAGGSNPWEVFEQIADERKEFKRLGIVTDSDPARTSLAGVTQARPPGSQVPEDTDPDPSGDEPDASAPPPPRERTSRARKTRSRTQ